MTLKQLEAFYLAANLGSFALAAQRAHVTQSSLSKRIAELESSIGAELFDRSSKRAQLTETGNRFLPVVAKMLELQEGLCSVARGAPTLSGLCRFGITELGALTWLPSLVNRLRAEHPQLELQPHVDLGRRLERQVVRGGLDFAVVPGPADDPRITSHAIGKVRFAWMGAPARLRGRKVLTAQDLAQHPIITQTEGSGLTRAFDAWAASLGIRPRRIVASNSLMAIAGLTVADVGISFLPVDFMQPWVQRGQLVVVRSTPSLPSLEYCVMHRADDYRALVGTLLPTIAQEAVFTMPFGHGL